MLLALSICLIQISLAQDSTAKKIKEIHFGVSGISSISFNVTLKRQLNRNVFIRMGAIQLSYALTTNKSSRSFSFPYNGSSYSAGLSMGLEFRKQLNARSYFYHGPNLAYRMQRDIYRTLDPALPVDQQTSSLTRTSPAAYYTLGFLYKVSEHFLLAVEIGPGVSYATSITKSWSNTNVPETLTQTNLYGSINNGGLAYLVYRF